MTRQAKEYLLKSYRICRETALQAQRDRFLTHAAHELRTPVSNIKTRLYLARRQPDRLDYHLDVLDEVTEQAAAAYREMKHCVVLGRGYDYATAHEWALKLKELTYVVAAPYSTADFLHGPVAILDQGFPVLAVAPLGGVYPDMFGLLKDLVDKRGVRLLVVSNADETLALAETPLRLPAELPPWISPMVTVVPAQLFSYHLARAKGLDVEHPRGLQKVTRTS